MPRCSLGLSLGASSRAAISLSLATFAGSTLAAGLPECGERAKPVYASTSPMDEDRPLAGADEHAEQLLFRLVGPSVLREVPDLHRRMLVSLVDEIARADGQVPHLAACFAPDTDAAVITAFHSILNGNGGPGLGLRYNANSRWNGTALNPTGGGQGNPTTLTWSYAPDGTSTPNGVGEGAGPSNLYAWLDGIYGGNSATWHALFTQVFNRWGAISGITYIYEPNDDGANFNNSPGVPGVRGDIRIAAKFIDGPSNVLAYNSYPQSGDMVLDSGDTFYNNTSNNSLGLRNTLSHEHGHGLGFAHVCPIQNTKLMEPFLSTSFDGPRHDEIRAVQRSYGDIFEPDNSPAEATPLGTLASGIAAFTGPVPSPIVPFGSLHSIDADGEQDWYRFTVPGPRSVSVTVNPVGTSYDDSDQACSGSSGSCCSGNVINSMFAANLAVQIYASDGSTVLRTADANDAGFAETISNLVVLIPGDYYIRVYETGAQTETQLYTMSVLTTDLDSIPLIVNVPQAPPSFLAPGVAASFSVDIFGDDTLVPGTAVLRHRRSAAESYQSYALTPPSGGGTTWTANIPAPRCEDSPSFFVQAQGSDTGLVQFPEGGAVAAYTAQVGNSVTAANLNFQTAPGWTVSGNALDGHWERGVPVTATSCINRGAPGTDYDGSGACWLTDNSSASSCNSDVDDGNTILTSPIYNIAALVDPTVSYARWYSNVGGQSPQQDVFTVQVSADGGTNWVNLEVVGPATSSPNPEVQGGWVYKSYGLAGVIPITNNFRIRFIADDVNPGSVVEAAVDAFSIVGRQCTNPPTCTADFNQSGDVTVQDVYDFLSAWQSGSAAADINQSGGVTVQDIYDFLSIWQAGCT